MLAFGRADCRTRSVDPDGQQRKDDPCGAQSVDWSGEIYADAWCLISEAGSGQDGSPIPAHHHPNDGAGVGRASGSLVGGSDMPLWLAPCDPSLLAEGPKRVVPSWMDDQMVSVKRHG